jgi:hypothetical protein
MWRIRRQKENNESPYKNPKIISENEAEQRSLILIY